MNRILKVLFVSGMVLFLTSCSGNAKKKEESSSIETQESVIINSNKKNETKEISQEDKEKDIKVLRMVYDKGTLLDNMIGNIGYNVKDDMNSDTLQVMMLFNQYFFEELYNPLKNEYHEGLKEIDSLEFGKEELKNFLSKSKEMNDTLEKGRTILLKLNADTIPEVAEEYEKWSEENDIFLLGTEVGETFSKMVLTKYSNDEDILDLFQNVILKSMEVYGDPTDFKNITGQEAVESKIVPGFEQALNK